MDHEIGAIAVVILAVVVVVFVCSSGALDDKL